MNRNYFVAIKPLFFIVIALMLMHNELSFAQSVEGVSVSVKQGSKDNETTITIINDYSTTVENLRVKVIEQPKIITNLRIEPASIQRLNPNETKTFTVKFDVPEDAEIGAEDSMKFFISANTGFFDDPYPTITLKIEKPDLPRKLKLLSVLPGEPENVEWKMGYSGFVERYSGDQSKNITSHCFKQLPLEIDPKEGFNLVFETKTRIEYEDDHNCTSRKGSSPRLQKSFVKISKENYLQKSITFQGTKDLNSYCDEGLVWVLDLPYKEETHKQGSTEAVLRFTPTDSYDYEYTLGVHLRNGKLEKKILKPKVDFKSIYVGEPPSLTIEAPRKFELVYGVPKEGEEPIKTAALCPEIPEFNKSLMGGGPLRYKYGYYAIFAKGSGFAYDLHLRGQGSAGVERLLRSQGPGDFVAQKRMEWLRRQCRPRESTGGPTIWEKLTMWAKGPFDSREAANKVLIISDWQVVGEVDPDEIRKAFCGGKDGGIDDRVSEFRDVPNLYGMSSKEAKLLIRNVGLNWQLKPGSPAKSFDKSGAVESQFPKPGVKVRTGSVVSLNIHSSFISMVKVPRVEGLSSSKAKALLAGSKLQAKVLPGKPAPNSSKFGTVQSQKPAPGLQVKAGSSVELKIYSKYIAKITVPDLRGFDYAPASGRLRGLGLTADPVINAANPPSKKEAYKVKSLSPSRGTLVKMGTKVTVYLYGTYAPTREEIVANTDCSHVRGSYPYWDTNYNNARCKCTSGYFINNAGNACVTQKIVQPKVVKPKTVSDCEWAPALLGQTVGGGEAHCMCDGEVAPNSRCGR